MEHYILKGIEPILEPNFLKWAAWYDEGNRRVAKNMVGKVEVSTVFLGLDHKWDNGPPMLFETMIFGGEHDGYQEWCSTWEEAEKMHKEAIQLVREKK